VYVYVSGIGGQTESIETAAVATGQGTDDQIKLVLAHGGKNYRDGYNTANDVNIYIDGTKLSYFSTNTWVTGGQLLIGNTDSGSWEEGQTCGETKYEVTVSIRGNVVYDGTIKVG
jgi:hypothetical protein